MTADVFSLTTPFSDCGTLNGVLDATADGDLNSAEKLVFICFVERTEGANTDGLVTDF